MSRLPIPSYSIIINVCTYVCICVFVDHLTADGLALYVSNEQPLLDEVISVTAFLSDNDKVCVCCMYIIHVIVHMHILMFTDCSNDMRIQ